MNITYKNILHTFTDLFIHCTQKKRETLNN